MTKHLHLTSEAYENLLQLYPDVQETADETRKYFIYAGVEYSTDLQAVS